jgi:protein SCO1
MRGVSEFGWVVLPALVLAGIVSCGQGRAANAVDTAAPVSMAVALADNGSVFDLESQWQDATGRSVSLGDLRGRVSVVALVYTNCSATCPIIVADLKRMAGAVTGPQADDLRLVLVSIDPERDSPQRLAEWGATMQMDPARWTLLAGSDDDVRQLAAVLDIRYQRQVDGEVAHTNQLTVLDRQGAIVHRQLTTGEATVGTIDLVQRLLR